MDKTFQPSVPPYLKEIKRLTFANGILIQFLYLYEKLCDDNQDSTH